VAMPERPKIPKPRGRSKATLFGRHERDVAKKTGGFRTPASGAFQGFKSDIIADKYRARIEAKATAKKSLSIKQEWLEKIDQEAGINQTPVLTVRFDNMPRPVPKDWAMIPLETLLELLDEKSIG